MMRHSYNRNAGWTELSQRDTQVQSEEHSNSVPDRGSMKLEKKGYLAIEGEATESVNTYTIRWGVLEIVNTFGETKLYSPAIKWRLILYTEEKLKQGDAPASNWNGS